MTKEESQGATLDETQGRLLYNVEQSIKQFTNDNVVFTEQKMLLQHHCSAGYRQATGARRSIVEKPVFGPLQKER